ncbi:MAG: S-layer homology domain-containing protein [Oscillospiraceae bacterium]|nr:S-layer homology domain-containing protein [Oscillospiraceae bacterium]
MRKKLSAGLIAFVLLIGLATPIGVAAQPNWETTMNEALDWIRASVTPSPAVGSVGGEWAVLALARAGRVTADDPWLRGWFADLDSLLSEVDALTAAGESIQNPASAGTFPSALRRWTDFQRIALALSSLGIDASNYNGRDLTAFFGTFSPPAQRHSLNQTINADIFALIALNSGQYSGDRNQFLESLLDAQRLDGAWSLGSGLTAAGMSDTDITAMAIQALAPLYAHGDARVVGAVGDALRWLRNQTFTDPESTSQMIVALTALGSDFADEAAYYVNRLLRWFDPASGAFRRPNLDSPVNMMATEQAAYALVAYWRFVRGVASLYDMSDVFVSRTETPITLPGELPPAESGGFPGRHEDVRAVGVTSPGRTFADVQNHANRPAIEALASRGIIAGRSETEFAPDATMTRAEFSAIITRGLGLPERAAAAVFYDVSSGAWFAGAVGAAFYYEIVTGVSPTEFNPNGTITRQEVAVMIARAARLAGLDTALSDIETLNILAQFGDYRTAAAWAWDALAFCYREGILDDFEFYIEPQATIRRSEIAEMLYRLLDRAGLV